MIHHERLTTNRMAVSLDEARTSCRQTTHDNDTIIERCVRSATEWIEETCAVSLLSQKFRMEFDAYHLSNFGDAIILPRSPATAIDAFVYFGTDNVQHTFDAASYALLSSTRVALNLGYTWPTSLRTYASIRVDYTAGFATSPDERTVGGLDKMPACAKQSVLTLTVHWFQNPAALLKGSISKEIELGLREQMSSINRNMGWIY